VSHLFEGLARDASAKYLEPSDVIPVLFRQDVVIWSVLVHFRQCH
jgi:hypothetical protein